MTAPARKILVIGKSGQLALSLAALGRPGVMFAGRPGADLADPASLGAAIDHFAPDAVINAGAYTSVDGAESDVESAFVINRDGPRDLARACAARDIPLVHISTDCVFDGHKADAYAPDDGPSPLNVYGESKWQGELAVAAQAPKHLIVRVSWLFSEHAGNFVATMLKLAMRRAEVAVVSDQWGFPTYTPDLARGLLEMTEAACTPSFRAFGIYHLASAEAIDRASMARLVFEESAVAGGPVAIVKPVPTSEYPTAAVRPLNARLDSRKALDIFGVSLPHWRKGLQRSVRRIIQDL
jgi:dTDP-4-dehydrorhamnose reductase